MKWKKGITYHRKWIFKMEPFHFLLGNVEVFGMNKTIFILFIVYALKAHLLRKSNTY